jgi:tape measure domain-containing protein
VDQQARFKVSVDSELSEVIQQLNKVASAHEALTSQVGLGNAKIDNAYRSQSLAINKLTTEITKQADAERKAQAERDKASAAHEKSLKQIGSQYDYLGNQVASFKNYLLGAFAVDQILNYGQKILDAAGNMQQFQISLEVMLQSKSKADKLMAEVVEFTKKTPFTLEQTQEATTRLLAYGVASEEVIRTLNSLGNIAAAVGTEKLPQLIMAFGQVKAAGHLTGAELRQFTEAGVNMFEALSATTGKSVAQIQKDISKGVISFADVQKAIFSLGEEGGRFANLMVKQSDTITGKLSNLGDSMYQFFAKLGTSRSGLIYGVTEALTDFFDWLGNSTRNMEIALSTVKAGISGWIAYKTILETVIKSKALLALEARTAAGAIVAETAATVTSTVATGGLTGAVNLLSVAFRANPIGFFIGLLSSLYTAYQLASVATGGFTEEVIAEVEALMKSNKELEISILRAQSLGEKTDARKKAIAELVSQYPEYFAGLDKEKITNAQLGDVLNAVNGTFQDRIRLANLAYKADSLREKAIALDREQLEVIGKLREEYEGISKANPGNDEAFLNAIKGQQGVMSKIGNFLPGILTGGLVESDIFQAGDVIAEKKKLEAELIRITNESAKARAGIEADAQKTIEINLLKRLNAGEINEKQYAEEYKKLTEEKVAAVTKIESSGSDKKKAIQKSDLEYHLEDEVKKLKAYEQTYEVKVKLLDAEEALMIERAKRQIKSKEAEAERILAIEQEYATKRQKLLESSIDYEMKDLRKIQEQADKEFKIRNTLAEDIVDLTLHMNGLVLKEEQEKAERMIELGKQVFETQKELSRATVALGEMDAVANAKIWQDKALVVEKYYQGVLEKALKAAKEQEAIAQREYDHYLKTKGADDELTQNALANLNKAKTASADALAAVGENSEQISKLTTDRIIEIAQAAWQVVQMLVANYTESTLMAADSLGTVAGYIDEWTEKNRQALQDQLADVTLSNEQREKLIDESLNRESELVRRRSAMLEMQQQLEDTAARTESTMGMVQSGLNAAVAFAKGDFVAGMVGVAEFVTAAFNRAALNQIQDEMRVLREKERSAQATIQLIEAEIQARGQALEAQLALLDQEMEAFRAAQEEKRAILVQASSDQQLRLQEDDNFRQRLLEAGEAREVAALEAARERELKRAAESGATAGELADIVNAFNALIAQKHEEYQNAMQSKTEAVSLATTEVKAQETDKVNALKAEEGQKAAQVEAQKKAANDEYRSFVLGAQGQIFEQQKQLAILEIRMEIAKLKAQKRKLFANKRALDDAIGEMEGLIGSITGGGGNVNDWEPIPGGGGSTGDPSEPGGGGTDPNQDAPAPKFHGTEYLVRMGRPSGRDTIPVMAHEGERIVQSYLNERLMKLRNRPTNAQLVEGYLRYDQMREKFPQMFNLSMPSLSMKLNSLAGAPSVNQMNVGYDPALLGEVRRLNSTLENKPGVIVNATKTGISILEKRANSLNRIYTTRYRA